MELRSGSLVGGSPGKLPDNVWPAFEEGVKLVLMRWTALQLAVENEWGGRDSKNKAEAMYTDILSWFNDNSEHYADDLEVDLEEIILTDFNTELEDDSPRQVSRELVSLHYEFMRGNFNTLMQLRQSQPNLQVNGSKKSMRDGAADEESSSDGSEDDEDMEMMDSNAHQINQGPKEPIVDEDGFQLVEGRKPRNRR